MGDFLGIPQKEKLENPNKSPTMKSLTKRHIIPKDSNPYPEASFTDGIANLTNMIDRIKKQNSSDINEYVF